MSEIYPPNEPVSGPDPRPETNRPERWGGSAWIAGVVLIVIGVVVGSVAMRWWARRYAERMALAA